MSILWWPALGPKTRPGNQQHWGQGSQQAGLLTTSHSPGSNSSRHQQGPWEWGTGPVCGMLSWTLVHSTCMMLFLLWKLVQWLGFTASEISVHLLGVFCATGPMWLQPGSKPLLAKHVCALLCCSQAWYLLPHYHLHAPLPGQREAVGCAQLFLLLLQSHFSRVQLSATPKMATHQAPPSLGFSRQEHWSGLPFPSPMHESESESEIAQLCLTHSDPMDYSPPGSSIHGLFQARVVAWVATAFSPAFSGYIQFKFKMILCQKLVQQT